MAEAHDNSEIFVYTGGDQVVPDDVVRVRIDKSVKIIPSRAFYHRQRSIKLLGVKIIGNRAFYNCGGLTEVLGDKVDTIEERAFQHCYSLSKAIMPYLKIIGRLAFYNCQQLTDLELPEGLETLQ
eukprot:scaffold9811_cov147-Skeletonema_marinoi.AAC.5